MLKKEGATLSIYPCYYFDPVYFYFGYGHGLQPSVHRFHNYLSKKKWLLEKKKKLQRFRSTFCHEARLILFHYDRSEHLDVHGCKSFMTV